MERQAKEQNLARRKEKRQVCIRPDSYLGREILYQTALLHEILAELRKNKVEEDSEESSSRKKIIDGEKVSESVQRAIHDIVSKSAASLRSYDQK